MRVFVCGKECVSHYSTYSERHDLVGDQEEEQVEVRHHVQEYSGCALGQVRS